MISIHDLDIVTSGNANGNIMTPQANPSGTFHESKTKLNGNPYIPSGAQPGDHEYLCMLSYILTQRRYASLNIFHLLGVVVLGVVGRNSPGESASSIQTSLSMNIPSTRVSLLRPHRNPPLHGARAVWREVLVKHHTVPVSVSC